MWTPLRFDLPPRPQGWSSLVCLPLGEDAYAGPEDAYAGREDGPSATAASLLRRAESPESSRLSRATREMFRFFPLGEPAYCSGRIGLRLVGEVSKAPPLSMMYLCGRWTEMVPCKVEVYMILVI